MGSAFEQARSQRKWLDAVADRRRAERDLAVEESGETETSNEEKGASSEASLDLAKWTLEYMEAQEENARRTMLGGTANDTAN